MEQVRNRWWNEMRQKNLWREEEEAGYGEVGEGSVSRRGFSVLQVTVSQYSPMKSLMNHLKGIRKPREIGKYIYA